MPLSATEVMRAAKERRRVSKKKREEEETSEPSKKGVPPAPKAPSAPKAAPPAPKAPSATPKAPPATSKAPSATPKALPAPKAAPPAPKAAPPAPTPFQAVSSQREFGIVKAAFSKETADSQILVLCGRVGCGKTYACRNIAASAKFHVTSFEPSDLDMRQKLHVAARKVTNAPRRATLIDDLDGFTEKGMTDVVAFLVQDWRPDLFDTVLVTIASWAPPPLRPLKSHLAKEACLFIQSPRPYELLRMGESDKLIKSRLEKKTPDMKRNISVFADGDIRSFKLRLGISPIENCQSFFGDADVDRSKDAFSLTRLCLSTSTRDSKKALSVDRSLAQLGKTQFVERLIQYNTPRLADLDDVASMLDVFSCLEESVGNRYDAVSDALLCSALARTACAASPTSTFATQSVEMFPRRSSSSKLGTSYVCHV